MSHMAGTRKVRGLGAQAARGARPARPVRRAVVAIAGAVVVWGLVAFLPPDKAGALFGGLAIVVAFLK